MPVMHTNASYDTAVTTTPAVLSLLHCLHIPGEAPQVHHDIASITGKWREDNEYQVLPEVLSANTLGEHESIYIVLKCKSWSVSDIL